MMSFFYKILKFFVLIPVYIYQVVVSPIVHAIFKTSCRYSPSCSQYLVEAVGAHGIVKGFFLGIKRILKCNPWVKNVHIYDPVTKNKS